jgi:hypothetical protein
MAVEIIEREGGSCNTHLCFTSETPTVSEKGIDTWRLVRYLDSDSELKHLQNRCDERGKLPEKIAGHTVGVMPGYRMMWAEGHPSQEGLASAANLAQAERTILASLDAANLPVGRDAGVGRLDQTVTLRFDRPAEGIAFLEGVATVDVPRTKPAVYGRPAETVYLLGAASGHVMARIYDKGLESGTAERGQLIRLENQTRYSKTARMRAAMHAESPDRVAAKFASRFAPVAESLDGIHAASMPLLAEHLAAKVRAGDLTSRQAERFAGYLLLSGTRGSMSRTTRWRRRRELRQHGLVLTNPLNDPVDVDVGAAVDAALAAWTTDDGS